MKSIEQKYQKLSDIEHCLKRPGMYIGSVKPHNDDVFLLDENMKFSLTRITYNPAFMKIFDEIISNSADEHRRNHNLNKIDVTIDRATGKIKITDNGGIPVVKHSEYDEWVPEMIFSNLKAGSNFDDTEERLVAGTNGVGSTLTNIFSKTFRVRTSDGKNLFDQTFSNNMMNRTDAIVGKAKGKGFTEITYEPDFERFGLTVIDDIHERLMRRRCADIAACNPALLITFNGDIFKFPKFSDYCNLYMQNFEYESSERWNLAIAPSEGGFQQVSFVNGVETRDGGTHVDSITSQIVEFLRERVRKKHKIELKPAEIRNHLRVFVQAEVVNPAFSSQTKEKLITEPRDFGSTHEISEKLLKRLMNGEIVQRILDWSQQKEIADERKSLREANKIIDKSKVLKLIDAKQRGDRSQCTVGIFEGDSAIGAFRKFRNPQLQGAFPLRGKFVNASEGPATKIIQNHEVQSLLSATGLRMGDEPLELRYGKILIYSDADPDGDSIAGLLMNFFSKFWPTLYDDGRICRVMTPLVVAIKGKERKWFYTNEEFKTWSSSVDILKWSIEYKKGLAALSEDDYREIVINPKLIVLSRSETTQRTLDDWFGDDSDIRKKKILSKDSSGVHS
jgi:DNA gyrase/topoisomerase IV subunit B